MPVKQERLRAPEKTAPAPALRKIQFGAIAQKKPDKRASYPILPDPQGQYATIAARIPERAAQVEALAGALDLDKAELKTLATPFYFANGQGKIDVPSSVAVACGSGQVLITYQNRYGKLQSEEMILPILGEQTGRFFRQAFTLEIDGDQLRPFKWKWGARRYSTMRMLSQRQSPPNSPRWTCNSQSLKPKLPG